MFRMILILFMALAGPVCAQDAPPILTVSGTGTITVAPDLASISLGVEVEAPTADRALRASSASMAQIFSALSDSGIDKKDIQTSQLSLFPQRETRSTNDDTSLNITGFVATNLVEITVRELPRLGAVLDGLTKSGANRIQGISFALADPTPVLDQARQAAVAEAMRKAALYADAAGLKVGAILSIDEAGADTAPMAFRKTAMIDAVPVAEGVLSFSASVTIRFALER